MRRFSIPKVVSQRKASDTLDYREPDSMDELDIVHSEDDALSDSVLITTNKEKESSEGIIITSEKPSYANVPERKESAASSNTADDYKKSGDANVPEAKTIATSFNTADDYKNGGDMDSENALKYLVESEEIPNAKADVDKALSYLVPSELTTEALDASVPVADPFNLATEANPQQQGMQPAADDSSKSDFSVPSEIGSSILDEPEEKLLYDLNAESSQPPESLVPDHSVHDIDHEETASQLSTLSASRQSTTHTVDTLINVGNCLMEGQEQSIRKSIDNEVFNKPATTAAQNSRNRAEESLNVFPEKPTFSDIKDASRESVEPEAEPSPQESLAYEESSSNKSVWERVKKPISALVLVCLILSLASLAHLSLQRLQNRDVVPVSAIDQGTEDDGVAPDEVMNPMVEVTFPPSISLQPEGQHNDDIPDSVVTSTPALVSQNNTVFSLFKSFDVAVIESDDVAVIDSDSPVYPELSWNHDNSNSDETSRTASENFLMVALSQLMKYLRFFLAALTAGAVGVTWLKTKMVPAPTTPTEVKKEEIPHTSSPSLHGNRKRNYHPLPKDIDLTKYEELRVKDLRVLLSSRSLDQTGRKPKLIKRLVQAYEQELWDEHTVLSLRAMLGKRGLKQGGLKHELVARLVEAGI